MSFKISTSWQLTDAARRGEFKKAVGAILSDIVKRNPELLESRWPQEQAKFGE
jgi:hypothetical protein